MPQLHFYVSEPVARKIRERAVAAGLSTSGYIAEVMNREIDEGWPEGYFERLMGPPREDELTRPEQPPYDERDALFD